MEIDIVEKYGIDVNNEIIKEAFTHSSYFRETPIDKQDGNGNTYERLEFLGDKIIDFVITEYMYKNMNEQEGRMSSVLANYVCRKAHYMYSYELGLYKYLRVGKNKYEQLCKNEHVVADIYEAFIGAVFIVYGQEKAKQIIYDLVIPKIENGTSEEYLQDYKTHILTVYRYIELEYEIIDVERNEEENYIMYTAIVKDKNEKDKIYGIGKGKRKKDAEQMAAKDAIEKREKENKEKEEITNNVLVDENEENIEN